MSETDKGRTRALVRYVIYAAIALVVLSVIVGLLIAVIVLAVPKSKKTTRLNSKTKLFVGENGAVAADIPECSEVGVSIMKDKNGNAVDAAVATCLCIGVIGSYSSGIGGGSKFLLPRMAW